MAIGSGVGKQIRYKAESSWGVAPGATGAQLLRRRTSDLNLVKDAYESNELRSDYQVADYRHGIRRVQGTINGEVSCTTYADFLAAILRKDFAAGASASSLTITSSVSAKTFVRSAGSWLTDGFKVGDVVRFTGYTAGNVSMNNQNYRIGALNATTMTVLNNTGMVDASNQTTITCAVTGKKTYVPTSGHTDKSFAIEHWFSDIAQSELFLGCKIARVEISIPTTGMAEIAIGVLGSSLTAATSAYFTTPTAETTTGVLASATGALTLGGADYAVATAARIAIEAGLQPATAIGSLNIPAVFPGRVRVSGEVSVYFENATLRDAFLNESQTGIVFNLADGSAANAAFINLVMPLCKFGGAGKNDGETGIIQTLPFTALLNGAGGAGTSTEKTTISIQDSQLS